MSRGGGGASLRVVVQQPTLAKYRVPVFRELARRPGIDLTVYYASNPKMPNAAPEGFRAEQVPMRRFSVGRHPVMWHAPQWRFAGRNACDVLILSWDIHYASLVPALLRARMNRVPTVLWGHGYSKQEAAWRRTPREAIARLGTALLLYNHTAANRLVEAGWNKERVFVGLNSLDQTPIQAARRAWESDPARLATFKREHGLDRGPVLLFVSRLKPRNRLDLLVEAVRRLADEFPGVQAVLIGKGEEEQLRLQQIADAAGVRDRLRFLGAIYDEHALTPWFLSADAFCYPAQIGLSIFHAFGYGLPVVTSGDAAAQNPEFEALRDGDNGLLYRDNNPDDLARVLARLFRDRELAGHLREQATRTVTDTFTLARMVDGFEAAIRYCAAKR